MSCPTFLGGGVLCMHAYNKSFWCLYVVCTHSSILFVVPSKNFSTEINFSENIFLVYRGLATATSPAISTASCAASTHCTTQVVWNLWGSLSMESLGSSSHVRRT